MAIASRGGVRDMRGLAARVHRRWAEYRRRHPGMSVPISDTLSRILEHADDYRPLRRRSEQRQRPQLQNPGVFTLQDVADALQTTIGDLLDEPGYRSIRDLVPAANRRTLRDAFAILRELFDLDDPSLDHARPVAPDLARFAVAPQDFVTREHDYPEPLRAWLATDATPGALETIREVRDPRLRVVRVIGDAMAPQLRDGMKAVVDTDATAPRDGDLVAVYIRGVGGVFGRWTRDDHGAPLLQRRATSLQLNDAEEWFVWGTITTVVYNS
jgi:hypothetical protein